jgi:hypothetical protein
MTQKKTKNPALRTLSVKLIAKLFLATLLTVLLFCSAAFLYIRFGLDGVRAAQILVSHVQSAIGGQISFSSADLSWTSTATGRIFIKDITIRDKPGTPLMVHIPSAVFEINLGHLLRGIFQIDSAEFSRAVIVISGESAFGKSESLSLKAISHRMLIYPTIRTLRITNSTLILAQDEDHTHQGKVLFSQIELFGHEITPDGAENLSIKGVVPHEQKEGSLDITGRFSRGYFPGGEWHFSGLLKLVGCPLATFKALGSHLSFDLPLFDGYLDFNAELEGRGRNWKARGNLALGDLFLHPGRIFVNNTFVKHAGLRFSLERSDENISLELTEVNVPGMNLSVSVKAEQILDQDPVLMFIVHKADLDLEKIFPVLPLNLIPGEDRDRLIAAGLKGHIVIARGGWKGKASTLLSGFNPHGTLELKAILDKVSGFVPGVGLPVSNATGEIRLNADEMLFKGISLTVGSSPIVLNGWIGNLKTSPRLDLFVSMKAEARDLQPLLENKIVITHLGTLAGWFTDPDGGISVTLDIKGALPRPEMKGRITFEDFQCRLNRLPLPIKKINGSIRFRGSGIMLSEIRGMFGSSPFVLKGNVSPENIDVEGDSKLNPADLKKLDVLPSSLTVSGPIPLLMSLKGKSQELTFSSGIDLKSNTINYGLIINKKAGTPLKIDASGTFDASGINVEDASLLLDKTRISFRAVVREDGRATVSMNLPPKGIPTNLLIPFIDPNLELQPGGRLEGDAIISVGNQFQVNLETNLLFSHVSLRLPGFHKRAEGLTGSIKQRARSLQLSLERARVGNSPLTGTLSLTDFDNPRLEILVEFPFMDTTDFTAPPGFISKIGWGEYIRSNPVVRFIAKSKGSCFIKVARGKTGLRAFSDFRANLEANNGLIRVPSWQMDFADGTLRGSSLFDIRLNTSKPLTVDLQGDRLRMERVMLSDPQWLRVSGNMMVEGRLEWKLGPSYYGGGLYKTGNIEVRMNDGVINRFDILSKLFSLVNLGSFLRGRLPDLIGQGLPFHKLTWNTEIFDNKWKVNNLRLLSDAARIDSSGMYFGGQERVDFRLDISPLVGIDAIVSGLFGNLITRDGKTLTTTFRIRGLYTSPDVRLEPFENLRLNE